MAKEKKPNEIADSLNKKGFYENKDQYKESSRLISYSQKIKNFNERLLEIYKQKLKKK